MQAATSESVRGAFDGRALAHFGVISRFFRRAGRFVVATDGPDGVVRDFPVAFTFGVFPLQQYLVELPRGRVQALPWAWDSRDAALGGARFFHLYPGERLPAGDALHWTGAQQNWNFLCAECHATGVEKNYDAEADAYATTWSEMGVACEACHGPGSRHVDWTRTRADDPTRGLAVDLRARRQARFLPDAGRPSGTRLTSATADHDPPRTAAPPAEIDACARCHSRRSVILAEYVPGRPLGDTHRPALLEAGLYFADGQIDGEVFEYGSFLQSRMHRSGVTCGDCHEPHGASLRAQGDALCTRCHAPERVAVPAHHHHVRAPRCVDCHMPERTYMQVDARRDHSLRVPRPDLSLKLGTPNACNGCHRGGGARWAAADSKRLCVDSRAHGSHYGEALHAGRSGAPDAAQRLARLALDLQAPGIARATALALLGERTDGATREALRRSTTDPDALLRLGAAAALEGLPSPERASVGVPLLRDTTLAVRLEAARLLAPARGVLDDAGRAALDAALDEYRAAQQVSAERPEAHMNLGLLEVQRGDLARAAAEYRHALRLSPSFAPAAINLADVLRLSGRDAEGEAVLRDALTRTPREASLHHALGLRLVRAARLDEALAALGRASRLAPDVPRYAQVYAVAREEIAARR